MNGKERREEELRRELERLTYKAKEEKNAHLFRETISKIEKVKLRLEIVKGKEY